MVEVVRALAEEAGSLSRDRAGDAADQRRGGRGAARSCSGGWGACRDAAPRLPEAAAVAGRQLDLAVLAALAGAAGDLGRGWLRVCADAAVWNGRSAGASPTISCASALAELTAA